MSIGGIMNRPLVNTTPEEFAAAYNLDRDAQSLKHIADCLEDGKPMYRAQKKLRDQEWLDEFARITADGAPFKKDEEVLTCNFSEFLDWVDDVTGLGEIYTLLDDTSRTWLKAREAERAAASATYSAIRQAHEAGLTEVEIANLARCDRMTVRRALGKL